MKAAVYYHYCYLQNSSFALTFHCVLLLNVSLTRQVVATKQNVYNYIGAITLNSALRLSLAFANICPQAANQTGYNLEGKSVRALL